MVVRTIHTFTSLELSATFTSTATLNNIALLSVCVRWWCWHWWWWWCWWCCLQVPGIPIPLDQAAYTVTDWCWWSRNCKFILCYQWNRHPGTDTTVFGPLTSCRWWWRWYLVKVLRENWRIWWFRRRIVDSANPGSAGSATQPGTNLTQEHQIMDNLVVELVKTAP